MSPQDHMALNTVPQTATELIDFINHQLEQYPQLVSLSNTLNADFDQFYRQLASLQSEVANLQNQLNNLMPHTSAPQGGFNI